MTSPSPLAPGTALPMFYALTPEQFAAALTEAAERGAELALARHAAQQSRVAYYTAAEAAELLKTKPQTISKLRQSGALVCLPIGPREYRISQSAIDALERAQ